MNETDERTPTDVPRERMPSVVTRVSSVLYRFASGRTSLAAFAALMMFGRAVMPGHVASLKEATGGSALPDMQFWYSVDDIHRMAEACGEAGRGAYVSSRFGVDMLWPLLYGFFLVTVVSWVYSRSLARDSRLRPLNLVAFAAPLCDVVENVSASIVMHAHPARSAVAGTIASIATPAKWSALAGTVALVLAGGVFALVRRSRAGRVPHEE
jgi:hypothetical protein